MNARIEREHPLVRALHFANSYSRIGALMDLYPGEAGRKWGHSPWSREKWFQELGAEWACCDNICDERHDLEIILGRATRVELDLMMDAATLAQFAALPPVLTVYRGCYRFNRRGLSWTLLPDVADRITTLNRYVHPGAERLCLTGRVRKQRCVLIASRGEQEIVVPGVRAAKTERLGVCPALDELWGRAPEVPA